jgi:hypothetical protein
LAIGGHQGGNPGERDDRPLQADGDQHDKRDKLTPHIQKLNCQSAPKQTNAFSRKLMISLPVVMRLPAPVEMVVKES